MSVRPRQRLPERNGNGNAGRPAQGRAGPCDPRPPDRARSRPQAAAQPPERRRPPRQRPAATLRTLAATSHACALRACPARPGERACAGRAAGRGGDSAAAAFALPGSLRRDAPGSPPRPAARVEGCRRRRRGGPRPVSGAAGAARPPPAGPARHGRAAVRGRRGRLGGGAGLRRGGGAGSGALRGLQEWGRGAGQAAGAAREREQPGHGGQEVQPAALRRRYRPEAAVAASAGTAERGGGGSPAGRQARCRAPPLPSRRGAWAGPAWPGRGGARGALLPRRPRRRGWAGARRGGGGSEPFGGPRVHPAPVPWPWPSLGATPALGWLVRCHHAVVVAGWYRWRLVSGFSFFFS